MWIEIRVGDKCSVHFAEIKHRRENKQYKPNLEVQGRTHNINLTWRFKGEHTIQT